MGQYMYRVTAKVVTLADGRTMAIRGPVVAGRPLPAPGPSTSRLKFPATVLVI